MTPWIKILARNSLLSATLVCLLGARPASRPARAPQPSPGQLTAMQAMAQRTGPVEQIYASAGAGQMLAAGGSFDPRYSQWGIRDPEIITPGHVPYTLRYSVKLHDLTLRGIEPAGDGRHVLFYGNLTGPIDDPRAYLAIWDVIAGVERNRFAADWKYLATLAALSPDAQRAVTIEHSHRFSVWNSQTGQLLRSEETPRYISAVAISSDGRFALMGGRWNDEDVHLIELETGTRRQVLRGHVGGITSCRFSPDAKRALTSSLDGTIRLWDLATGKQLRRIEVCPQGVFMTAISPDGLLAATLDSRESTSGPGNSPLAGSQTLRYWDLLSRCQLGKLQGPPDPTSLDMRNPDNAITVGCRSGVMGFRIENPRPATAPTDFTDADPMPPSQQLQVFLAASTIVGFTDNRTAFSGTTDNSLAQWDIFTGVSLGTRKPVDLQQWPALKLLSLNGQYAVSMDPYGDVRQWWLWELANGLLAYHADSPLPIRAAAISPKGDYVAIATAPESATVDVSIIGRVQKNEVAGIAAPLSSLSQMLFSPDGLTLTMAGSTASGTPSLAIWDLKHGQTRTLPVPSHSPPTVLSYSANGRLLLCACREGVSIFDLATDKLAGTWPVPGRLESASISSDGRRFLTGGWDSNLRLWDAINGRELAVFPEHRSVVSTVAFSPDGRHAASGGRDGAIRIWNLP